VKQKPLMRNLFREVPKRARLTRSFFSQSGK
jgi:hypothetical protein